MITWHCKSFAELSVHRLYDLLKFRCDIFVVEQNCPYPELDGIDTLPETRHLFAIENSQIIAYARLIAEGDSYPHHSCIGRVAVAKPYRRNRLGHTLIDKAIGQNIHLWPKTPIKIGAQSHLERFYQSHGFNTVSEAYLEDGIEHYQMSLLP